MKERELYLERIHINKTYSIQVDEDNHANLLIYEGENVIEVFSLTRRIHTLFKILYELVEPEHSIVKGNNTHLYADDIRIKDNLYMKATDSHEELAVVFYKKHGDGKNELLYVTKMAFMTQKLFNQMLIPFEVIEDPDFPVKYPKLFKGIIDVLNMITI